MEQILVTRVNGSTYLLEDRNAFRIIQSINQKIELRSNDIIDINLESREFFSFTIGDSFTYFGKKYTLNQIPKVDKVHSNLFRYSITFEGVQFDLRRASYDVNIDTTGSAIYGETLTANLELFLRVLIENANRVFLNKWALGAFPSETETKTLTFSEEENCLSVLQTLCNEYDYDFTIKTENGVNVLNILQVGQEIALEFKVGFQQGLYNLSRDKVDSNDIVTRLKVYGSSQNLGPDYRSNRLVLKGKNKPNSYIDNTAGIAKYGVYEQTKIFEDIYPRRKGKVTAINSDSVLKFSDSSMDFDLKERDSNGTKYLLDGVSAKIHFNTGNLAGYEFEISDYNHSTKEFTIIKFTDENDYTFPATDNNVFRIGVNDEYVILDIKMPQAYIDNAEVELLEKGTEFLADKQEPLVQYTLDIDTLFLQRALNDTVNEFFQIGDFVKVIDTDLELNRYIRIKAIERNLNNPFDYKLTLSDAKVTASLGNSIISDINTINNIIRINNLNDPARAKRNWKDAQEVLDMVFDVEGDYYTEKIKPNSIETMHLQVGAKSMQFNLVDSRFEPNLNGNPNLIQWSACKLIHFTIEETIKEWQITAGNKTLEANKPYYIYARCNKNNNIGVIEITETQYKVDAENYYYFLIGILNSYDSTILAREISLMYGFSTISGRFIKTGRIQSADGGTYFDLDSGEFKGKFTFSNGQNIEDAINNIEVGGRNLFLGSSNSNKIVSGTGWLDFYMPNFTPASKGDTFTASVDIVSNTTPIIMELHGYDSSNNRVEVYTKDLIVGKNVLTYTLTNANVVNIKISLSLKSTSTTTQTYIYNSIKLEKGNKATDWSPAPEDMQNAIDAIQTSVDSVNITLNNIASDNVLTPSEKQQVANEWNRIKSEYTNNLALANSLSVSSTSYISSYNTLNTYITPLLANLTTTSEIIGSVFRTNFNNYYTTNVELLKSISVKLQSNIDNIEIGGRNLILKSPNFLLNNSDNGNNSSSSIISDYIKITAVNAGNIYNDNDIKTSLDRIKGDIYTLSFEVNTTKSFKAYWYPSETYTDIGIPNTLGVWKKVVFTYTQTGNGIAGSNSILFGFYGLTSGDIILYRNLKLEKGNRATDWTPAPEDVQSQIAETNAEVARAQTAINRANTVTSFLDTTIDGNVISTGMMQVGDKNQANAGVSGLKENGANSVRFWAGATANNRNSAPFRVQDNGKVFMTNAYVQGEVYATSGTFSGTVRATEGYIGGFQIKDNILKAGSNTAGVWFDSVKDNSFTSVKVGNYIGDGIPTWNGLGNNLFPVISIEGNDTDTRNLFRAGIYINLNTPDNSIVSKPAIQIDNGHIGGVAYPITSYINNETIHPNADVVIFNANGNTFNNSLYLPENPRIGKVITIMNIDSGIASLNVRSRNHNIGKGRYGAGNSFLLSRSGTFMFIGNIWILTSEINV